MPKYVRYHTLRADRKSSKDLHLAVMAAPAPQPAKFSLDQYMPPRYNQGDTSSCTGHAIARLVHYQEIRQGIACPEEPSPYFIYANERIIENSLGTDAGGCIVDGIKSLASYGYCGISLWPSDPAKICVRPSAQAYLAAKRHKVSKYMRVQLTEQGIKQALLAGHPIVCGIQLYEYFESDEMAKDGIGRLPVHGEMACGGHAVVISGYDMTGKTPTVEFQNSWGNDWGDHGKFTLPLSYVTNPSLAQDAWVVLFV